VVIIMVLVIGSAIRLPEAPPQYRRGCSHQPHCPAADAPDRDAACRVAPHPEQGWNLLCNGVVTFDDTGELLPDGHVVPPHRPTDTRPADTRIAE
jgi:hypothetical protein